MLLSEDREACLPPRLYRSPAEIRCDMQKITDRISEIQESLSVRNILMELVSEWCEYDPRRWVSELSAVVEDAEEALSELRRLKEVLEDLKCELEQTKEAMGI